MPLIDTVVQCPVHDSFRVRQVSGIFDLPLRATTSERFAVEIPGLDEGWQIGVIVGPSGSGKSTIAKAAFGDALYLPGEWCGNSAVVDGFGPLPIKEILHLLGAVGLSSPPAWIKPYNVLSNGEKFRCDLARALANSPGKPSRAADETAAIPVVFDEFSSVVDRTVAKIGAAAVATAIRCGRVKKRFVAVTCHYDVVDWLQPDWVVDMATSTLARGRLRRPEINLDIRRAPASLWTAFKRHHYLSAELHRSATCFVGCVDGSPAVFTAALFFPHPTRPGWKEHRTVCLPDFQGVGIGNAMSEFVAALFRATGKPYYSTTSHPAMIRHRCRSPLWRVTRSPQTIIRPHACRGLAASGSAGRLTAGFEYVGHPREEEAKQFGLRVGSRPGRHPRSVAAPR